MLDDTAQFSRGPQMELRYYIQLKTNQAVRLIQTGLISPEYEEKF